MVDSVVQRVNYSIPKEIELEDGHCVNIKSNYFLPVEKGDRFLATLDKDKYPTIHPYVVIINDERNIKQFFFKARVHANNLYQDLTTTLGEKMWGSSVEDVLNKLACDFHRLGDRVDFPNISIDKKDFARVLSRWYHSKILRQLYLFQLRRRDIMDLVNYDIDELELLNMCFKEPYKVPPIPLDDAKNIVRAQGRKATRTQRRCGAILREVWKSLANGHSYCKYTHIEKNYTYFEECLERLPEYDIIIDSDESGKRVYHKLSYNAEIFISNKIKELLELESPDSVPVSFDESDEVEYTDEQKHAIISALSSWVSIITGPAGSGKSTILKKIYDTLKASGRSVCLTSFTGKAVNRIHQIIGDFSAETMDYYIVKNEDNKFEYLIIDEASMVSTGKLAKFLSIFKEPCKIILIGDLNQLPPISYGSLLQELSKTQKIPTFSLSVVKRVDEESGNIIVNSQILLQNQNNPKRVPLKSGSGVVLNFGDIGNVKEIVKYFYENDIETKEFKILCPFRKYLDGFNSHVQETYFERQKSKRQEILEQYLLEEGVKFISELDSKKSKDIVDAFRESSLTNITANGMKWCLGDRIVMNENNYTYNLRNGQEGVIVKIDSEYLTVSFEGRKNEPSTLVDFYYKEDRDDFKKVPITNISLAYALTIHKSQGSEYSYVILFIPYWKLHPAPGNFLNMNLLYTGITRAKTLLFICGDKNTFYDACKKRVPVRLEKLASRIGVPYVEQDCPEEDFDDFDDFPDFDSF